MISCYYKYSNNINDLNKMIIKRTKIKDPFNLVNKKIKLFNSKGEKAEKKILGIEILPLSYYSSKLDELTTNNYYSSNNKIDISNLKMDYCCYDNKIIILTLS